jgi:hypothetical protein
VSTSLEIGLNGLTIASAQGSAAPPPAAAMNFGLASNSQYIALIVDEL